MSQPTKHQLSQPNQPVPHLQTLGPVPVLHGTGQCEAFTSEPVNAMTPTRIISVHIDMDCNLQKRIETIISRMILPNHHFISRIISHWYHHFQDYFTIFYPYCQFYPTFRPLWGCYQCHFSGAPALTKHLILLQASESQVTEPLQ